MDTRILVCGDVFVRVCDALTGPAEILAENNGVAKTARSVGGVRRTG